MIGRCSICQDGLDREEIAALKCGHTFHLPCVSKWFERSTSCPVCCRPWNNAGNIVRQLFFDCGEETPGRSPPTPRSQPGEPLKALLGKVQYLETELRQKDEQIAAYQAEVRNAQEGIQRVQMTNSVLRGDLTRMHIVGRENNSLRAENQRLQSRLARMHEIQHENNSLREDNQRLINRQLPINQIEREIELLREENRGLRTTLAEVQCKMYRPQENARYEEEMRRLNAQIDSATAELAMLQHERKKEMTETSVQQSAKTLVGFNQSSDEDGSDNEMYATNSLAIGGQGRGRGRGQSRGPTVNPGRRALNIRDENVPPTVRRSQRIANKRGDLGQVASTRRVGEWNWNSDKGSRRRGGNKR